ncbi:hypothetical protein [Nocardia terpenica]|uniref:Uncharacterized protein n=1 Tax=Nocardia terpenica TaxID=455432 RepID=A0A164PH27_9NOCA|nr:hypothetical protein [Nocardia terpenica]KZM75561.1 hypothetical protein AWN90_19485 [Nocardia terpenica]NQE86041.1 hypothetical protein [Nocardia terpenica]
MVQVVLNYAAFVLVFAFGWWAVSNYKKMRPREFWKRMFTYAVPLYILAGIAAWSGWATVAIVFLPLIWLVFFIANQ